jgi:hypothetical protein
MPTFNDLLTQHIGASFARQLAFADLLEERSWSVSVSDGIVTFGQDLRFPIQLLGTEADGDGTWLWAWANAARDLPDKVLVACNQLRELGERQNVPELRERKLSLDEQVSGHSIALVASGTAGRCCYYRGPYDGGALFFLVGDAPDEVLRPVQAERAITVITEVISIFAVNHRSMVEAFLHSQGFSTNTSAGELSATRGQDQITVSYDAADRITNIGGSIAPRPPIERSAWWQFWKR